MKNSRPKRNHVRKSEAMALVSIVVLGAFAIAVMMSIFELTLNIVRSEASSKIASELRNAAESGADYGLFQMNKAIANEEISPVESVIVDLPSEYLPDSFKGTVRLTVRKMTSEEWALFSKYATGYSPELDIENGPNGSGAKSFSSVTRTNIIEDHYRILEVTAREGVFFRSIRSVLEPRFDIPPGESTFRLTNGLSPTSFFKNPIFGNSSVNAAPNSGDLTIDADSYSDGSNFALDLRTNGKASIKNSVLLKGNLVVSNNTSGAPLTVATLDSPGNNATILGRVSSNSNVTLSDSAADGFTSKGSTSFLPGDNVLANGDSPTAGLIPAQNVPWSGANQTPINADSGLSQAAPAPVPSDGAAKTLNLSASPTLSSGSYSTSSLQANGASPVTTSGTVKVFIQDGANTGAAADINASALTNAASPQNLQIWYEGSRPINLNLNANFNGVIYAPNAPVNVTGSQNFTGAVVADKLNLQNSGSFKIITNLSDGSGGGAAVSYLGRKSSPTDENPPPAVQGYKSASWQEFNKAILNMN